MEAKMSLWQQKLRSLNEGPKPIVMWFREAHEIGVHQQQLGHDGNSWQCIHIDQTHSKDLVEGFPHAALFWVGVAPTRADLREAAKRMNARLTLLSEDGSAHPYMLEELGNKNAKLNVTMPYQSCREIAARVLTGYVPPVMAQALSKYYFPFGDKTADLVDLAVIGVSETAAKFRVQLEQFRERKPVTARWLVNDLEPAAVVESAPPVQEKKPYVFRVISNQYGGEFICRLRWQSINDMAKAIYSEQEDLGELTSALAAHYAPPHDPGQFDPDQYHVEDHGDDFIRLRVVFSTPNRPHQEVTIFICPEYE